MGDDAKVKKKHRVKSWGKKNPSEVQIDENNLKDARNKCWFSCEDTG